MRFALFVSFLFVVACEYRVDGGRSSTAPPVAPPALLATPPPDGGVACTAEVDRAKELLVVDRAVLESRDARCDVAGAAFSFRSRIEELAAGADAARFTLAWLGTWTTVTSVSGAPVTARPAANDVLSAPWRALRVEASIADAPFRLIAIANRLDLTDPELRFVYTAVDPGTRSALAMTVIVEIAYPAEKTPAEWAAAWHALPAPASAAYGPALASLVRTITQGADPARTRVRTNEAAFGKTWEMRQFVVGDDGALAPTLLPGTPRAELDGSSALEGWLADHEPRLASGVVDALPQRMLAAAAPIPDRFFQWELASPIGGRARLAFGLSTCNGCHGGERGADALPFQQLAPWDAPATDGYYLPTSDGGTRVSGYLDDDLGRRAKSVAALLCAAPRGSTYAGGMSCP